VAVDREGVAPEAVIAAARRWPLKKIRAIEVVVSEGGAAVPETLAAVQAFGKEIGRPVSGI